MKTTLDANDEIKVFPADPDGNNQAADGKSADKAVIQYTEYKTDPDATVDLSLSGGNGQFADGTKKKDKVQLVDGAVTVPFYSTASSYVTLTAYLTSDHKTYGYCDFHFAPAVQAVDLEVVPGYDTAPPDGSTPDKVKATVRGYDGKGIAHFPVTFQSDPQATLDPAQPQDTQSDGTATVSITNTKAGDVRMTATAGGVTSSPVTVHFGGSALTVKTVDLKVDPDTALADGQAAVIGTATVTMSDDSLAPDGTEVTFMPTNGATATPTPAPVSGGQGQATARITSETAGASSVTASSGGIKSASVTVQFTAVPSTVKTVDLQVDPTTAPADGKTAARATATVTMSDGSPAPDGTPVKFTPTNGAAADPSSPNTSGGKGQATARITSKTAGASSVVASAGAVNSDSKTVQFTQVVDSVAMLPIPLTMGAAPDGVATILVTAIVVDQAQQPVADGTMVTFSADRSADVGGQTTIDTPQAQTKKGLAATTVRSTVKGWRTIKASVGKKENITSIYFGYGQYVQTIDLSVDPDNQFYRGMGTDVVHANVYLDDEKTQKAPKGVQLTLVDLSSGSKLGFSTSDGNPPETNDDGVVAWNVRCGEAGEFRVKVVADNGVQSSTTVNFVA